MNQPGSVATTQVRYVEDDAEPGPDGEYPPKSFKEGAGHGQAHSLARLMTTPGKTVRPAASGAAVPVASMLGAPVLRPDSTLLHA